MSTKEQNLVKESLEKKFPEVQQGKDFYLPPFLVISADIMDYQLDDMECECKVVTVEYISNCQNKTNCDTTIIQFYIYAEEHKLLFAEPEELPDKLKIPRSRIIEKESVVNERDDKEYYLEEKKAKLSKLEAMIILKCYVSQICNDKYVCSLDNYRDILALIFIFCPDVLCCAIKNESSYRRADTNVLTAIRMCLKFYSLMKGISSHEMSDEEKLIRCFQFPHFKSTILMLLKEELKDKNDICQFKQADNSSKGAALDNIKVLQEVVLKGLRHLSHELELKQWKKILRKSKLEKKDRNDLIDYYNISTDMLTLIQK